MRGYTEPKTQGRKGVREQEGVSASLLPYDPAILLAREESGQSLVVMLLVVLPLLLLILGVVYDLGNVAAGVVVAQNAADLAAHEAGKLVDVGYLMEWQEVRLRPQARLVAQRVAEDLTGGAFWIDAVYVEENVVVVEGHLAVRTPFLHTFVGIPRITRTVRGVAEMAHGAERSGE